MFSTTITSLDKDKVHILGISNPNMESFSDFAKAVYSHIKERSPELQFIILPFTVESVASRPLTELELQEVYARNENTQPNHTPNN